MKRTVIAVILAMAIVCSSAMAVISVLDMGRTWGDSAACSGALTSQDLSLLTALHPETGWTAYAQTAPQVIVNDEMPDRTSKPAVLSFLGEPERIAFFVLASGRLPLDGEHNACALDSDTAFRLFGSVTPGDVSIRMDGEMMRVVGVMDAPRPLLLIPAREQQMVGVAGAGQGAKSEDVKPKAATFDRMVADDRDALLTLATTLGITTDPFELSGAELSVLAWLVCIVPWFLIIAQVLTMLRKRGGGWRVVGTALLSALLLGALLGLLLCVPVRLLPNRWSDLAFYGKQLASWKARPFRVPDVRDELLKLDMLRVGIWCAISCIALWMERKWLRCGK